MAYIDPSGMFGGERMALLSDSAKMAWPWFWCASNTVGRIELNYRAFCDGPFRQFRRPPTEKQFWEWVTEFHEANLMFAYENNGKAWGQWDVTEKYLPKYKTEKDKKTPAPMLRAFVEWQKRYLERKQEALSGKCPVLSISGNLPETLKLPANSPVSIGVVVGVDLGLDKTNNSAAYAAGDLFHETATDSPIMVRPTVHPAKGKRSSEEIQKALGERLAWWEEFWAIFPCRDGKLPGMDAFERRIKTLDLFTEVLSGARAYAERFKRGPDMKLKYAQGWINDERWTDEGTLVSPPGVGYSPEPRRLMLP
jgi:hypothetical protein